MYDDRGKVLNEVTPGSPVQIFGWKSFPVAGDIILEAKSEVVHFLLLPYL